VSDVLVVSVVAVLPVVVPASVVAPPVPPGPELQLGATGDGAGVAVSVGGVCCKAVSTAGAEVAAGFFSVSTSSSIK